jgi:hypothetical protein
LECPILHFKANNDCKSKSKLFALYANIRKNRFWIRSNFFIRYSRWGFQIIEPYSKIDCMREKYKTCKQIRSCGYVLKTGVYILLYYGFH